MKTLASLGLSALILGLAAPVMAADLPTAGGFETAVVFDLGTADEFDRRGRGRSKPRVPGGSGCDDPRDIIEHPECAG